MSNYYKNQLQKVNTPDLHGYKVKIRGGYSETFWLDLNKESAQAIIEWLTKNYLV